MRAARLALAGLWLALNGAWLAQDRLIRDGDEEGHVGAAELFRGWLADGAVLEWARNAWMGELGEYPPLYAALVGAWWWLTDVGQPGAPWVRGINLLWPLLAAAAVASLARRVHGARGPAGEARARGEAAATAAWAVALALPLGLGLGRHFMPEGLVLALVAASVAVAAWAAERPGPGRALALGAVLGLGLLSKQTFLLLAAAPVLAAGWRLGRWWAAAALSTAAAAAPWYLRHLQDQLRYGAESVQGQGEALAHAGYYPWTLLVLVLGPAVSALLAAAVAALLRRRGSAHRRALAIGAAWLLGGLVVLTAIPKKYPRLAAPLAPAAALLIGAGVARLPRGRAAALAAGTAATWGWAAWASVHAWTPPAAPTGEVDPRCAQVWLRPPDPRDLGLAEVARWLDAAPDGPVGVVGAPPIPCDVQTTHDWVHHLGPYLRRHGRERAVLPDGDGVVQLRWVPADGLDRGGPTVAVPALDAAILMER